MADDKVVRDESAEPNDDRLQGWGQIAQHFGCDTSTVQRWSKLEGLPVQRHEHRQRASVYAFTSELDEWQRSRETPGGQPDESTPSLLSSGVPTYWLVALGALVTALVIAPLFFDNGSSDSSSTNPQIRITQIPPYNELGGGDTRESISGSVSGVKPEDYRVILYTVVDLWYVQPLEGAPTTPIHESESGLSWSNWTHAGKQYAALLVRRSFVPPMRTNTLPEIGGDVLALTIVDGER